MLWFFLQVLFRNRAWYAVRQCVLGWSLFLFWKPFNTAQCWFTGRWATAWVCGRVSDKGSLMCWVVSMSAFLELADTWCCFLLFFSLPIFVFPSVSVLLVLTPIFFLHSILSWKDWTVMGVPSLENDSASPLEIQFGVAGRFRAMVNLTKQSTWRLSAVLKQSICFNMLLWFALQCGTVWHRVASCATYG